MKNKVILILSDGMKGDSVLGCKHKFAQSCVENFTSKLDAQAVMPSVTLPCHMSLFLSVSPERHGILTNTYVPQVRPVKSLINALHDNKKTCAMFYNWEELRDISRPGALSHCLFTENELDGVGDEILTQSAIEYINEKSPDFVFLYLGCSDHIGHHYGWESEEYIQGIYNSFERIEKVFNSIPKDYTIIVTSDHGGHDRTHGTNIPEDMSIPVIAMSDIFTSDVELPNTTSLIDIAPTIAELLGIPCDKDWEGKSFVPERS